MPPPAWAMPPYGGMPPPALSYGPAPDRRGDRRDDRRDDSEERRPRRGRDSKPPVSESTKRAELDSELRRMGKDKVCELVKSTLESLYKDRIRPLANYVRGRFKEKASGSCADSVVRSCVDVCRQHPDLCTVENGATAEEATILLVTEPPWFKGWIDIDSTDDPYDESLWKDFEAFLETGPEFAGGRYGMARQLAQRELPFLKDRTLGEICHIVQLAVQHRKIIIYDRKILKSAALALTMTSDKDGADASDLKEITDMNQLSDVLMKILREKQPKGIRLDRMKNEIKQTGHSLNTKRFQCPKLIELFGLEPLKSTFQMDQEGDRKSVV